MTIESLKSVLATGGQHLGDLVWWSLAEAQIDRATLEQKWLPSGLPKELLPEMPTVEKALKTAVKEAQCGQPDRLIRLARNDEEFITFAVVKEHKHENGTLSYSQEARITLDKLGYGLNIDDPTHPVALDIKSRFDRLKFTHTPDDIRRMIVRTLVSFSAVTLRESGGVYWVPAPHAKGLRSLQGAIESIGHSRVYLLPVHDSADAHRTLGDVAQKSIEEELEALKTEVRQFVAAPPDRPSTLNRRFEAFEALRARAELYRTILHVQVTDLDSQIDALAKSVELLLNEKKAA